MTKLEILEYFSKENRFYESGEIVCDYGTDVEPCKEKPEIFTTEQVDYYTNITSNLCLKHAEEMINKWESK